MLSYGHRHGSRRYRQYSCPRAALSAGKSPSPEINYGNDEKLIEPRDKFPENVSRDFGIFKLSKILIETKNFYCIPTTSSSKLLLGYFFLCRPLHGENRASEYFGRKYFSLRFKKKKKQIIWNCRKNLDRVLLKSILFNLWELRNLFGTMVLFVRTKKT